ncbi:Methyltransferase domain-containing protein [Fictibacillus solisalsi]|uniref:Methyltransferase domain-containing protein n=1 Tax=Fictibacillus solisalsi TaxID=459525 RepID=A0A1G9WGW3_9BACL|nr:class I SAM-dependent methyltransferase [Fictibacillus solisalsi]SDM83285.1 Methyltransferase domain-containing protein [Fictibacillus solisalsi]
MSYQHFAYYYDQLMEEAPYGQWISFFEQAMATVGADVSSVLDVGCGTGSISIPLALKGYDVTGIDLSDDMLAVAHEKSMTQHASVQFLQQDMTEIEGLPEFDAAVIFCDSLNYLLTEEKVAAAFHSVHRHLKENGIFLFDVHSLYKIHNIFSGNTFAENAQEISYIWQCYEGEYPDSVEHELSFFVHEEDSRYTRFDEVHMQRTLSVQTYEHLLEEAGFTVIKITGDFSENELKSEAERIFFICKKSK